MRQGLGQQIGHQTAFFCSFCSRLRSLSSGVSISMVVRAMMFDAIKITHQMSTNMTGVPAAGLLTLLVLRLAVVQLPPLLILAPIIIYVFSTASTLTAVVFMVWSVFAGSCDAFLKPLLLGRGVAAPMLVIFVGAIGGFILEGIIGFFVGAVVLALGYQLFLAWLNEGRPQTVNVGRRGSRRRRPRQSSDLAQERRG